MKRRVALAAALAVTGATLARAATPWFTDDAARAGLKFRHSQGTFISSLPETTGAGAAFLDLDGDGELDVFLVQGSGPTGGAFPSTLPRCKIFRNRGDQTFDEVGESSGVIVRGLGNGCLATDLNNDGYPDLVVTRYHEPVALLMNNGDGTFTESAVRMGLGADAEFATYVIALDYDRDGMQDLYLGRYVREHHWQQDMRGWWLRALLHAEWPAAMAPQPFHPSHKSLYRNRWPQPFEDVTAATGTADPEGRGMGAVGADFDGDGWPDLFLANDVSPSTLLRNVGGKTFEDIGPRAYLSFRKGAMGIAVGDVQDDGGLDVVITRWHNEYTALYTNGARRKSHNPTARFSDRTQVSGFMGADPDTVGWATGFLDVNGDGIDDLLVINGDTNYLVSTPGAVGAERAFLFLGEGEGKYHVVAPAGPDDVLSRERVGRGAAFGDLGRDGAVDVVLNSHNGAAELWRARPHGRAWITLELCGTGGNRDGLNARVELQVGDRIRLKELVAGESYLSSNAREISFGLGDRTAPVDARVRWASGVREVFRGLEPRRFHRLVEGSGAPIATP